MKQKSEREINLKKVDLGNQIHIRANTPTRNRYKGAYQAFPKSTQMIPTANQLRGQGEGRGGRVVTLGDLKSQYY